MAPFSTATDRIAKRAAALEDAVGPEQVKARKLRVGHTVDDAVALFSILPERRFDPWVDDRPSNGVRVANLRQFASKNELNGGSPGLGADEMREVRARVARLSPADSYEALISGILAGQRRVTERIRGTE